MNRWACIKALVLLPGTFLALVAEALLFRSWGLAIWGGVFFLGSAIYCDSPDLRRQVMIDLKSISSGHIEFLCRTLRVEARKPVDLLRREAARSDQMMRICSFCKKVAIESEDWVDAERAIERMALFRAAVLPKLSHGVCPAGHAVTLADM